MTPSKCLALESYFMSRVKLVRNEEIYDSKETVPLSQSVKARQIRFLGHCLRRHQEDLISTYALNNPAYGKPRPGGRKVLFNENAAKLINPEYLPFPHEIREMAQDREAWKRMEDDYWHRWYSHERLSRAERERERIHSLQQFIAPSILQHLFPRNTICSSSN